MRNNKINKMIIGCICFVVVIGICGLFTADYGVNRFMVSFAAGLEADSLESAKGERLLTTAPKTRSESAETKPNKGGDRISKPTGTVTREQAKKVRENLTVSDKATVVTVILKSLSFPDLKKLQIIAQGGLTVEEKREAKQLLLAKLSPDDYNVLSALAKKYGISRGNTYDEAKQEHNS